MYPACCTKFTDPAGHYRCPKHANCSVNVVVVVFLIVYLANKHASLEEHKHLGLPILIWFNKVLRHSHKHILKGPVFGGIHLNLSFI